VSRKPPEIDDEETSIYEGDRRPKKPTKRGHAEAPVPEPVPKVASEPIRAISMKTPGADAAQQRQAVEAKAHAVKLRAIAELSGPAIQLPLGNLAPPRDPKQARMRRARDFVILGLAVIIVGSLVMVGVLLVAR
jgi:hypothetical protein